MDEQAALQAVPAWIRARATAADVEIAADGTLSKSAFARLVDRNPAAVTKWIRSGKLSPVALAGKGRTARVRVVQALAELGRHLDVAQQYGQRPTAPVIALDGARAHEPTDQERYLAARARKQEIEAQQAEARLMAERGEWLRRADAEAAWNRQMQALVGKIEETPQRLAEALEREFGLDVREATIVLRREIRRLRREAAAHFLKEATRHAA